MISNIDQEKYKIVELFKFYDYSSNINVETVEENGGYDVKLLNNGKLLKKWTFLRKQTKQTDISWNGKYEGRFLRLKEEAADSRAWGKIKLEITNKKARFLRRKYRQEFNCYKLFSVRIKIER